MFAATARLFGEYGLWRGAGLKSAGRALVEALSSEEEDLRTVAGMLLVRGKYRARPILEEALDRREHLPMVLSVLADLGDPGVEARIQYFVDDPDPDVAAAARQALRALRFRAASDASSRAA